MKENRSSRTALGAAFFRAVESTRPRAGRVCCDPLARHFLGRPAKTAGRNRYVAGMWHAALKRQGLGPVYGEVVVRTRYIDDLLARRLDEGVEQVVVLGAGFDTRAYRFADPSGRVRFFELDHPATQADKSRALGRARLPEPGGLTLIPVDFSREGPAGPLRGAGYDPGEPALFIWEGVSMYLGPEAIDETLGLVAGGAPGVTSIVFNYVIRIEGGAGPDPDTRRMLERMRRWGEPVVWGLRAGDVEGFLAQRGLQTVENARCEDVGRPYFQAAGREEEIAAHMGIAHARVT